MNHREEEVFPLKSLAKSLLAVLINLALCICALALSAAETSPRLTNQLQQPIRAAWEGQQLGTVLQRISGTHGIAIWLDRRVDPQQEVSLRTQGESVGYALEQLAGRHGLGLAGFEDILYIGPTTAAIELPTLHNQLLATISQASIPIQRRWLTPAPLSWPKLSEPRELLRNWLQGYGITLQNDSLIPHDLWSESKLPNTSLATRVTLLLVGFDFTCELSPDGSTCTVAPIRRPLVVEHHYRRTGDDLADVERAFPEAQVARHRDGVTISGTSEVHAAVRQLTGTQFRNSRQGQGAVPALDDRQRYSLKLENKPVGPVVAQLANQLGLQVVWDPKLIEARDDVGNQLTSCEVTEVRLEELLQCLLQPLGLQFHLEGNRLTISDAP